MTFSIFSCFLHPIRLGKFLPRSVGRHPDSIVSVSPTATLPFVIPSVAEGSAVLFISHQCCGPQDELSSRLSRRAVDRSFGDKKFRGSFGYR